MGGGDKPCDSDTTCVKMDPLPRLFACVWMNSDQKVMKKWWDDRAGDAATVCGVWALVGRKNTPWLGQHYFPPQTHEYVMKSECEWRRRRRRRGEKMADKEEWEEMKQEACVSSSPLGPPPSCYIHSLFCTVVERKRKRKAFLCVCWCACD